MIYIALTNAALMIFYRETVSAAFYFKTKLRPDAPEEMTMRSHKFLLAMRGILATAILVLAWATVRPAAAHTEKAVYRFTDGADGGYPEGGLIADKDGNLYGTTFSGGGSCEVFGGCGTVFRLSRAKEGGWTLTVLHTFLGFPSDGESPSGRLVFDAQANLYGTTSAGGSIVNGFDSGTVYELTPTKSGEWTETIIHNFGVGNDGAFPYSNLVFDPAGNLYGTTNSGGGGTNSTFCTNGCGTVFELSPQGNGQWTETILHAFHQGGGGSPDGQNPFAGVAIDSGGNLYGTTYYGGPDDDGTVFRLSRQDGEWKETGQFAFRGLMNSNKNGNNPYAGVIVDGSGNIFGTTAGGGNSRGNGVVFELSPGSSGKYQETVIHELGDPRYVDGELPYTTVVMDAAGNLYGGTFIGGGEDLPTCSDWDGCGVVFKLAPNGDGTWNETILYAFTGGADGGELFDDSLLLDSSGAILGTTFAGGDGSGVVFAVKP